LDAEGKAVSRFVNQRVVALSVLPAQTGVAGPDDGLGPVGHPQLGEDGPLH
jgi:hypothetical protein